MKKRILTILLTILLACTFCACNDSTSDNNTSRVDSNVSIDDNSGNLDSDSPQDSNSTQLTKIKKYETANKDAIKAALNAMEGHTLALQDDIAWGISYDKLKSVVEGPYIYDTANYLTTAAYGNLPVDDNWKDANGNPVPDNFVPFDILSYYAIDSSIGLYEYGYMSPDANLYQYDFLKEYYTNKYGKPEKENWEWNDPSYEPTGEEDYYQMFSEGLVKVITVWDIKELDTVLVIDWLNDPKQEDNNFGQISFYNRSDDFSVKEIDSTYSTDSTTKE